MMLDKMKKAKPTSARVQRNRAAATQAILDAARAIMREEGVAALSMQELARRMDMRAPSLYNYFSSKMDVYDALFRLGITMYDAHLQAALTPQKDAHAEIRVVIESYMSFALANPELYQLCFERPVPGFVPSQQSLDLSFGILEKSYARAAQLKKQLNTRLTPQQIVNLTIATAHGLTAMHLANEPHLAIGQGRFGSLIPVLLNIFQIAMPAKGDSQ
jgi:AcrR family transcriptional regulator